MKTLIIWANCQGNAIKFMLDKHYKNLFDIYVYANYDYIKNNIKLPDIFYKCDIFIYQNYSFNENIDYDIKYIIENILPTNAQKISFPTLHRSYLQFCYCIDSPENKNTINNEKPHGQFFFGIKNVRENIYKYKKLNYSDVIIKKEILNDIKKLDFILSEQIIKYENESLNFLRLKALNSDIPDIYNYILNNYKIKRLWHNPNHPNGILLNELCREIFKKMNLIYIDNLENINLLDNMLNDWKMPIFDSIIKYYDMINIDNNCSSWYNKLITNIDTYISEYVDFCLKNLTN